MEVEVINKFKKLGIDLGSRFIKITSISKNDDGQPIIHHSEVYDAVGGLGDRSYYKGLKQNIKDFTTKYNLDRVSIQITMSSLVDTLTGVHFMTLPATDDKILKKAVKFEIEESELVDNVGDHHLLWKAKSSLDNDGLGLELNESDIQMVTIKKNIIYEIAQIRKLKWKIESIELQSDSIGRLVDNDVNTIVVDFGHNASLLYLYRNGVLTDMEVLSQGGAALTEKVRSEMNLSTSLEAELLKHKAYVIKDNRMFDPSSSEVPQHIVELITEESDMVIDEIKRMMRTFEINEMITIDQMYYSGSGVYLKNFEEVLVNEMDGAIKPFSDKHAAVPDNKDLAFEVVMEETPKPKKNLTGGVSWDDIGGFDDDSEEDVEDVEFETEDEFNIFADDELDIFAKPDEQDPHTPSTEEDALVIYHSDIDDDDEDIEERTFDKNAFMYAYSATQYDVSEYNPEFNFAKFLVYKFDFTSILIAVAVLALTLQFGVSKINDMYDSNISAIRTAQVEQISTQEELQEKLRSVSSERSLVQQFMSQIGGLKGMKGWYSDILYILPGKTPEGVTIHNLNIKNNNIILYGYSTDYSNVGFLAMELESIGDVEIVAINELNDANIYLAPSSGSDLPHPSTGLTKVFEIKISNTEIK